jgi:transposase
MTQRATLPDLDTLNPEALKALIVAQHEQLLSKEEQLVSRDEEIERLKLLIAKLRRMEFGCKSEKLDRQIEQLELRLDELEASRAQRQAAPAATAASVVNQTAKRARQPLPAHLPRETRKILPKQEACPDCGGKLKPLGEDVSEMLEWVPEHFKVIQHVRPKLTCACCDKIVQAEAASRPIVRGLAGPGLLAHVLVSKYCDHLPLYRQSEIYARDGVDLDRSTMAEWVGGCSRLLEPLVEALRRHVMSAEKLHADDTPVPVLAPGKGKTKTGRLWTYVPRPCGSPTHRIARANIRKLTCASSRASCKPMVTRDTMRFMKLDEWKKSHAWRTLVDRSTICTRRTSLPLQKKRWSGSRPCMPSRKRFAGVPPKNGPRSVTHAADRSWNR